jgi:pimeloyl-ACP methyl ester carboxylesterase
MNTPHERLTRTTFSLRLGEVHALVGGAVNAHPLLFLHGFPDHPPTAVPFLEHLAGTHRVVAPWLRGYAPLSDRRSLSGYFCPTPQKGQIRDALRRFPFLPDLGTATWVELNPTSLTG